MKKLLSVLMVASMVSLVACKGGKHETKMSAEDSTKIADSTAAAEKVKAEAEVSKPDPEKAMKDSLEKVRVEDSIKHAGKKGEMHKEGEMHKK